MRNFWVITIILSLFAGCNFELSRGSELLPGDVDGRATRKPKGDAKTAPYARLTTSGIARPTRANRDGSFLIRDLPNGRYATQFVQDDDGDGRIDRGTSINFQIEKKLHFISALDTEEKRIFLILGDIRLKNVAQVRGKVEIAEAAIAQLGEDYDQAHIQNAEYYLIERAAQKDITSVLPVHKLENFSQAADGFLLEQVIPGDVAILILLRPPAELPNAPTVFATVEIEVGEEEQKEIVDPVKLIVADEVEVDVEFYDRDTGARLPEDAIIQISATSPIDFAAPNRLDLNGGVLTVSAGVWNFNASNFDLANEANPLRGGLYWISAFDNAIFGGNAGRETWRFFLSTEEECHIEIDGESYYDCDGDGIPRFTDVLAAVDFCAETCENANATCEIDGFKYDCNDDDDEQRDIDEPNCLGLGVGDDLNLNGICNDVIREIDPIIIEEPAIPWALDVGRLDGADATGEGGLEIAPASGKGFFVSGVLRGDGGTNGVSLGASCQLLAAPNEFVGYLAFFEDSDDEESCLWLRTFSPAQQGDPLYIRDMVAQPGVDRVVVMGQTRSTTRFATNAAPVELAVNGDQGFAVVYDKEGQLQHWLYLESPDSQSLFRAGAVRDENQFSMIGESFGLTTVFSSDDQNQTIDLPAGNTDLFVMQLDGSLQVDWAVGFAEGGATYPIRVGITYMESASGPRVVWGGVVLLPLNDDAIFPQPYTLRRADGNFMIAGLDATDGSMVFSNAVAQVPMSQDELDGLPYNEEAEWPIASLAPDTFIVALPVAQQGIQLGNVTGISATGYFPETHLVTYDATGQPSVNTIVPLTADLESVILVQEIQRDPVNDSFLITGVFAGGVTIDGQHRQTSGSSVFAWRGTGNLQSTDWVVQSAPISQGDNYPFDARLLADQSVLLSGFAVGEFAMGADRVGNAIGRVFLWHFAGGGGFVDDYCYDSDWCAAGEVCDQRDAVEARRCELDCRSVAAACAQGQVCSLEGTCQNTCSSEPTVCFATQVCEAASGVCIYETDASVLTDTWHHQTLTNQLGDWQDTGATLPARYAHAMGNVGADTVLVFGGKAGPYHFLGDTWLFEDGVWTEVSTATGPGPRAFAAGVGVPGAGFYLYGGETVEPDTGEPIVLGDFWFFDANTQAWSELKVDYWMGRRKGASLAKADPLGQNLYFFAGIDGQGFANGQLNILDLSVDPPAWVPPLSSFQFPQPREDAIFVFNDALQRLMMVGGRRADGTAVDDEYFEYDGTNGFVYEFRSPGDGGPIVGAACAFDPVGPLNGQFIHVPGPMCFGGEGTDQGSYIWQWPRFVGLDPNFLPPARTEARMATVSDGVILVGGRTP